MKTPFFFIITLFISSFLISCKKESVKKWDIDILGPLASASLNFSNIISDNNIKSKSDGSLKFVIQEELFKLSLDSLVQIPDTTTVTKFSWPFNNLVIQPGSVIYNSQKDNKYNLKGIELVETIIKSGKVEFEYKTTLEDLLLINFKIPFAKKNGISFSVTDTIPAGSKSKPSVVKGNYDLSGYSIDLTGINGNAFNLIANEVSVTLNPQGAPLTVGLNDFVEITSTYSGITPEFAKGYFGKQTDTINSGSQKINFFKNITSGIIDFEAIDLNLIIKNGVGVDIQAKLNEVTSFNTQTNNSNSLLHSIVGSSININRSKITSGIYPPVLPSEYKISLSQNNSNIDKLFEILPDSLKLSLNIDVNPNGNISNYNDFVYYGTGIEMHLDMEIPFSFSASNLTMLDTILINSIKGKNEENTPSLSGFLYIHAYNSFPLEAKLQLYLLDETNTIIDSVLTQEQTIKHGMENKNQFVEKQEFSKLKIPVNNDKIEKINQADKLIIKVVLDTKSDSQFVKIYDSYKIDIKLIADFTVNTE